LGQARRDSSPTFWFVTQGVGIEACWIRRGENSGKDHVSLSLMAPALVPRKLYANLACAAEQDQRQVLAVIWNPAN